MHPVVYIGAYGVGGADALSVDDDSGLAAAHGGSDSESAFSTAASISRYSWRGRIPGCCSTSAASRGTQCAALSCTGNICT